MKLRNRWLIAVVAFICAALLKGWVRTLRFRVATLDGADHPTDPEEAPFIYAFWHDSLLAAASFKMKASVLISQHADGELIARICQRLGFNVVRGSTTRGGSGALMELMRQESRTHFAITPDGPRGPRHRAQLGAIFLASTTDTPIIPVGVGFSRAWRAKSWDQFAIPRPFSVVTCLGLQPVSVPRNLSRNELDEFRQRTQERMQLATQVAQEWAELPCVPHDLPDDLVDHCQAVTAEPAIGRNRPAA